MEQRPDIVGSHNARAQPIARLHQETVADLPHIDSTRREALSAKRFPAFPEEARERPEARVNRAHLDARHGRCRQTCSLCQLPLRKARPPPSACEYASGSHAYTLAQRPECLLA
jgi:hypothetical protein